MPGLPLPAICILLGQSYMRQHPVREFLCHLISARWVVIKRWDEREDRRSRVRRQRHVADVDFVERRLANAQHERPTLFETHIGGALDQARSRAIGNAAKRSDAAR